MQVQIITSTLGKIKSTSKGQKYYTVVGQKFDGVIECFESGKTVKRIKLGEHVEIFKTQDITKATAFIKQCQKVGTVVELEV